MRQLKVKDMITRIEAEVRKTENEDKEKKKKEEKQRRKVSVSVPVPTSSKERSGRQSQEKQHKKDEIVVLGKKTEPDGRHSELRTSLTKITTPKKKNIEEKKVVGIGTRKGKVSMLIGRFTQGRDRKGSMANSEKDENESSGSLEVIDIGLSRMDTSVSQ